jgi:transposase-like protein
MRDTKRARYTLEFKMEAVRLVRLKMERDIAKKATAYFAREST